jgi:outer membrane lipoprotein carrier protein
MYSFLAILFSILLFSSNLYSQTSRVSKTNATAPKPVEQTDKKAQEILNQTSKTYKSFSTIKADFKYTLESRTDDFKEQQQGNLLLKGDKFRLSFGEYIIICDNRTIWTFMKEKSVNEVQINRYNPKDLEINPSEMFTIYEKGFLYKYIGEKMENGRAVHTIDLTPTDKDQSYFKVKLTIDKATHQVVKTQIYEKTGNIYTYEIVKLTPNTTLEDNLFQFNTKDYPGVTVVDLR